MEFQILFFLKISRYLRQIIFKMGLWDLIKRYVNKDKINYESVNSVSTSNPILHIWEDNYLMIEFISNKNLNYLHKETKRISNCGADNFDGYGYTEITEINQKPQSTKSLLLEFQLFQSKLLELGIYEVKKFICQDVGIVFSSEKLKYFGNSDYAIGFDINKNKIENIWYNGFIKNELEREKVAKFLKFIGDNYNFLAVNWFHCEVYDLKNSTEIQNFVKNL